MTVFKVWVTSMIGLVSAILIDCLWSVTRMPVREPGVESIILLVTFAVVSFGGLLVMLWRDDL